MKQTILCLISITIFALPLTSIAAPVACYCVTTARLLVPETPRLDAKDFLLVPFKWTTPHIGGLVLMKYGEVYHIAVVTGFGKDGFDVFEGNYRPCEQTRRTIKWNDEHIVRFLYLG